MKKALQLVFFVILVVGCRCRNQESVCSSTAQPEISSAPSDVSLLIAECLPGSGIGNPQILVRYRFQNGVQVAREEILKAPISQVRYDLGGSGVKVWSALSGEWTTIELGWFAEVIGWIKEGIEQGTEGDAVNRAP